MLFQNEINIKLGNKIIVSDSKITINQKTKYSIIGPNGAGKTTVLNHIFNNIDKSCFVLFITQSEQISDYVTILDYMLKSNSKLHDLYVKCEDCKLNNNSKYDEYLAELYNMDFDGYKSEILKILHGMGFNNCQKNVRELSGGQQTKLALCKALLLQPELLLLDEPTNHLDLKNIFWLQNYLLNYKKSIILVSHNIDFFDNIADTFLYFFNIDPYCPKLLQCKSGYDNFVKMHKQMKNTYVENYKKYDRKISELKKKNDKTELERFIQNNKLNKPIRDYDISIKFNIVPLLNSDEYSNVISFNDICFSYSNNLILNNVNIGISMKSRYILVGDNGSGKSTFFNLCVQNLQPQTGIINFNNRIRIGYFNQLSITQLDEKLTPIQYLQSIDKNLDEQNARIILSKVGFKKMFDGDDFNISKLTISDLSGGQKVKLVLCGIMINSPHVILFDEPSNHLDIYSIDEFIKSINEYNGGVIIITHDKHIIENINNYKLLVLENKTITEYNDGFDKYCEKFLYD